MRLGSALLRFESVSSTNDVAREYAMRAAPEGTVIVANAQTAGRGSYGRAWSSAPKEGLYCSIVLRPAIPPASSPIITLGSAVAVAETLALDFEITTDIKWPNDVLASNRKICGILVESAVEGNVLQFVVVGIGVNLSQRRFPEDIREVATSLFLESGREIRTQAFLPRLLARLERVYRTALSRPDEIISRWESLSTYAQGRAVRISCSDGRIDGVTRGLTSTGALVVETDGGRLHEIVSGEVTLRPAAG